MTKTKFLLFLIFILSLFFRIFQAWKYPPLLWDEASLGYNAYSILKTGKDEYGNFFPLIFKSFGDYKPGLYIYLAIPFVTIFGLNPLSVRFPSIILGSLLPIFTYLLILQLLPKNKKIALISALLISFNPYNIHFSHGSWESNVMLSELVLAIYFFFKSINTKKSIYFIFSSILFRTTILFFFFF